MRKVLDLGGGFVRLRRDPVSGDLLALNTQAQIYKLTVNTDGSGSAALLYDASQVGGGDYTLGMTIGPDGAIYVIGNATRGTEGKCTVRKGMNGAWSTVAETVWFPLGGTQYDHRCNGAAVSPDNRYVFFNSGSRTEHGEAQDNKGAYPGLREIPLTSAIFRVPTDGRDIELPNDEAALVSGGYLYADGVRNAFDIAFAPDGRLLGTENGPDADFPEELNDLRQGNHYGFPWRFGAQDNPQSKPGYDASADKRLNDDFLAVKQGMYRDDPDFPPPPGPFTDPIVNLGPDADQSRLDDGGVSEGPISTFTPHRSPLGLVFDSANALSGNLRGGAFVVSWGAAGGDLSDRGEDLLHLNFAAPDQLNATQLVTGFNQPIDAVLHNKTLYVLDFGGDGAVWAIDLP